MTREEKEQTGKYVLQMARLLEDGCYQQEMLLKAVHIINDALKQKPSGDDVVSRDVVKEQMIMYGFHAPDMTVTEFVKDLPPVNPKEPTTKNDCETCIHNKGVLECDMYGCKYEPTTKNDLGVDCISKQAVLDLIADYDLSMGQVVRGIHALPSVTPQEPHSFKWCTDCKEYDQEKHCCHRWSKVIRDTVKEMKQEQESILGKLKVEINKNIEQEDFARSVFINEEKDYRKANQCTGNLQAYEKVLDMIDNLLNENKDG